MLGHLEAVRVLLDAKADPNARAMNGGTALMAASVKGYPEVVRALLAAKADVNARTGDGQNGTFVRGAEWAEGDCATAQGGWSSRTVRRGTLPHGDCSLEAHTAAMRNFQARGPLRCCSTGCSAGSRWRCLILAWVMDCLRGSAYAHARHTPTNHSWRNISYHALTVVGPRRHWQ
jgi:hypothetical protein